MNDEVNNNEASNSKNRITYSRNSKLNEANSSLTIREALVEASSFLAEQGVADGRSDAELLMQHMLGWDRSRLLLEWRELFPVACEMEWSELLRRRGAGEPVQYMLGEQEFYGLPFVVNPDVLIPRPETELLVEAIMKRGREIWPSGGIGSSSNSQPVVADIGTGSGAIAVSLAVMCPSWHIVACDLSSEALKVARSNAERNQVAHRIRYVQGDLLEPFVAGSQKVDILISNPPYINSADMPKLQREVRDHEPHLALDGGEDGLQCYRKMLEQMGRLLAPPRLLGFEVGAGQALDVAGMLSYSEYWEHVEIIKDYAGIERHVISWRLNDD